MHSRGAMVHASRHSLLAVARGASAALRRLARAAYERGDFHQAPRNTATRRPQPQTWGSGVGLCGQRAIILGSPARLVPGWFRSVPGRCQNLNYNCLGT